MYYTYVLHSKGFDKIYVGYSSDVIQRLLAHNDERNMGWTRSFRPWYLLHQESFPTKQEAMQREKQLKSSRGRIFIRGLIEQKSGTDI